MGDGSVVTSVDGVDWVQRYSAVWSLYGLTYGNGQFVAVGLGGTIVTSTDGATWVPRRSGTGTWFLGIAYGNGHFLAVGDNGDILQSGSTITLAITPNTDAGLLTLSLEGPSGLAYAIQSSTDLISWRNLSNITSAQPTSVIVDVLPDPDGRVFYRAYSQ